MVLECIDVYKRYDHVEALRGVSLALKEDEILGLLGDNGAGKSTLTKILRGAIRPTSGKLLINGKPKQLNSPVDALREGIQCIYQESTLIDQLTVAENFFLGQEPTSRFLGGCLNAINYKVMRNESKNYLKTMGFDLDVTKEMSELSGGQRQAVSVLRAIYFRPHVLLLDEPTTGLSEMAEAKIFKALMELKSVCPMIFVTHILDDAIKLCDRIAILKLGKIVHVFESTKNLTKDEITHYMRAEVADE